MEVQIKNPLTGELERVYVASILSLARRPLNEIDFFADPELFPYWKVLSDLLSSGI